MTITQKAEEVLVTHLHRKAISIPQLQLDMKLSYSDAKTLIEYAQKRKWLTACLSGNEFPIVASDFSHADATDEKNMAILENVTLDGLKLLVIILKNFGITLPKILEEHSQDEEDTDDELKNLLDKGLIFTYNGCYYCIFSKENIKYLMDLIKTKIELISRNRRRRPTLLDDDF